MEVSDHAQFHARCHFNDIRRLTMLNLAAGMTSVTGTGSVRTYEANIKDAWCLLVTPLRRPKKTQPGSVCSPSLPATSGAVYPQEKSIFYCGIHNFSFICMPTVPFSVTDAY